MDSEEVECALERIIQIDDEGGDSQLISLSRRGAIKKPNEEINTTWRKGLIRGTEGKKGQSRLATLEFGLSS